MGAIATLNRLIGVVSRALANKGANWAETLQQVVSKHNESPYTQIFADASKQTDMRDQGDMDFYRIKRQELRAARGFRALLKVKLLNRRLHKVVWSDIHRIKGFDANYVQDLRGRWYPIKDVLPTNAPDHEIPAAALRPANAPTADDEIQDDTRTIQTSMDRVSPSASRGERPSAQMRDRQLDQTEAADVMGDIDRLVARVSARQAAKGAPIQTVAEANAAVELRRDLFVEKSVTKQRTPGNVQRLERIQADIRSVNARLRAWEQQRPEWRPGG